METVSWEEFRRLTSQESADTSWAHLSRNHCMSIQKAVSLIGYAPNYQPEQAVYESMRWLINNGQLHLPNPLR